MALASLAAPASAQWYPGWDRYSDRPYYGDRPYYRDQGLWGQPRRDPYGDGYEGYEPDRDRGWQDERYDDDSYYDERQQPRGYGDVRNGGARPFISPRAPAHIAFRSSFPRRSIVIDTAGRKLYLILSPNDAYQYPISVGRQGFSWTGTEVISRKQEWPEWYPPKEMMARDSRVPEKMTGGINNPLGALALYLGKTLYRIHSTNDPNSIGRAASSGCFRMMNEHVLHLAMMAPVGTSVTVVRRLPGTMQPASAPRPPAYNRYLPQRY
jgi:hypothetical protein